MDKETLEKYKEAGRIAAESLQFGKDLVVSGAKVVDVLDQIEEKVVALGGLPAFPAQVSFNHVAAHFCPEEDDELVFNDEVVCLDVGVHVDGFVGDNALTVDLSRNHSDLVNASREALNNALSVIKVGTTLGDIGKAIQDTIQEKGFAPVKNLSGHGLDEYIQHTAPSIPNFDTGDTTELTPGMAFAVEPFASAGTGFVQDSGSPTLFSLRNKKPVRNMISRQVLKEIETYNGLPFTTRWLTKKLGAKAKFGLRELEQVGAIHPYPPLADQGKGLVSQAEHTVVIDDSGEVHITTKLE